MPTRSMQAAFDCDPSSPSRARHAAGDAAAGWQLDAVRNDVELVVSELVSNAVLHAMTPVSLLVASDGAEVTIEVRDEQPIDFGLPPRSVEADVVDLDGWLAAQAMSGRGLRLVGALVDTWGIDVDAAGKTVWVTKRLTDAVPNRRSAVVGAAASEPTGPTIALLDVPVDVVLRNIATFDDRVRELALAKHGPGSGLGDVADRFADAAHRSAGTRLRGRRAVRAAAARGDRRVTMVVPGDDADLDAIEALNGALVELDDAARRGDLLSPPAPDEVHHFRSWCIAEGRRQLRGDAPSPYPGT